MGLSMDHSKAFATVALAAVSWDGVLTMAGTRALRHALDYRQPYSSCSDEQMIALMDDLLRGLRAKGAQRSMEEAAAVLNKSQRSTAFAVAAEIMRSDGPLQDQEREILNRLAEVLELEDAETTRVMDVMDVLHANVLQAAISA